MPKGLEYVTYEQWLAKRSGLVSSVEVMARL